MVIRGDGRILRNLTREGVIEALKQAEADHDRYASVLGWIAEGLNYTDLEAEAGYHGASETECLESLEKIIAKNKEVKS